MDVVKDISVAGVTVQDLYDRQKRKKRTCCGDF